MLPVQSFGRRVLALALAFTTLAPVLGGPAPTHAADPIVRDHRDAQIARVHLAIKRIIVHHNQDEGAGQVSIQVQIVSRIAGCPAGSAECRTVLVKGAVPTFEAEDGSVQDVNRTFPSATDEVTGPGISPAFGIPIHAGREYAIVVTGTEADTFADDVMGTVVAQIKNGDGMIRLGTYTERGSGACIHTPLPGSDYCSTDPSAFSVEYEIRAAPVPDLKPVGLKVHDLVGTTRKLVCMGIVNSELGDAGPFEAALKIDGVVPPGGTAQAGKLDSGTSTEMCFEVALPATGEHTLETVVDEQREVLEYNETNNILKQTYVGTGVAATQSSQSPSTPLPQSASTTPVLSSASGPADLSVRELKVNGRAPSDKAACKDGKATVTVVVKNDGETKADGVTVRLAVDGKRTGEQKVDGLDPGKEREVRFEQVSLKQGAHTLRATVSAADEERDSRDVTVRCSDDA